MGPVHHESMDYVPVAQAKPRLTDEQKREAKVMFKRNEELARRQRFFDAKRRTIGVDKHALDLQVEEKRAQTELDKERQQHFDQQTLYFNNVIKMQEFEARGRRKELESQSAAYMQLYSKEHHVPEPEFPPRDPRGPACGPSSIQVMAGEDLAKDARTIVQKRQQREWYEQQIFEREQKKFEANEEENFFKEQNDATAQARAACEQEEKATRRRVGHSRLAYNQREIEQRGRERAARAQDEEDENNRDVEYQLTSDFLNESTPHITKEGAVRATEFKGGNDPDALHDLIAVLEIQQDERAEKKAVERTYEAAWARHDEGVRKALVGSQRAEQQARRDRMQQLVKENQAIAAQKKVKEVYARQVVYTNECGPAFWQQFGTSTR